MPVIKATTSAIIVKYTAPGSNLIIESKAAKGASVNVPNGSAIHQVREVEDDEVAAGTEVLEPVEVVEEEVVAVPVPPIPTVAPVAVVNTEVTEPDTGTGEVVNTVTTETTEVVVSETATNATHEVDTNAPTEAVTDAGPANAAGTDVKD